jgi:polyisoprenoid-binding protein YceI
VYYATGATITPEGTTIHYAIETKGSRFTVKAFAAGLLSGFGHNPTIAVPDFEGEILLHPDAVDHSSLRLVIRSASLIVSDDISEKDRQDINRRMHEEVLESDSFPDIVYECSRVSASPTGEGQYRVALDGELTLHGVKRSHPVSARVSVSNPLRAMGECSVRLSDYEIRPVSALGGAVKLKDELKLWFDISARKQG